nr:DUF1837 domain-containing protein [uncultured Steroidobacter sp.]
MSRAVLYPDPFLEVRVQIIDLPHPLTTLCAGYDGGKWRSANLADHLFEWLPYAALSQEHQLSFASHNFLQMLRVASAHIYNTKKTATRGELGELLLHLCCILHFGCAPVVCKLILKSSSNDTVKGFDGVHVLPKADKFELWLGESKFYMDGQEAIRDSIESVRQHVLPEFLSAEKAMLFGHVGPDVPHRDAIVKLLKAQTSGDQLLKAATFPILIAYESKTVANFKELSESYVDALTQESLGMKAYFRERASDLKLRFQLILVPLERKADVVARFDEKLRPFL